MRKTAYVFVLLFSVFILGTPSFATTVWLDKVIFFDQPIGSSNEGGPPTDALGAPDARKEGAGDIGFVSIDIPETLIVAFTDNSALDGIGNDIRIYEYINTERALVYASMDNSNYVYLGTANGTSEYDIADYPDLRFINYVKFIGLDNGGSYAGFDLDAIEALNSGPHICPYPMNHLDYCRDCGPCDEGDGDCDSDSECEAGLTCEQVPGIDTCQSVPCTLPVGHLDYCRDCDPCPEGEGDCDDNSECQGDLICRQVTGVDTCQKDCTLPVGHLDYCRECGPCDEGEGDCDNNNECAGDLTCPQVPGTDTCQGICDLPVGHLDYCQKCGPCAAGEGDCDIDSECQSGLTCIQVTGTDVCCSHPLGHLDYCRDCGPCAAGQGDCDNDSECAGDLTCPQVPGTDTCQ